MDGSERLMALLICLLFAMLFFAAFGQLIYSAVMVIVCGCNYIAP